MKTNTFEHLENLCRAKGIVCERYSRNRITLTTPSGGTEAECKTVTEALDCIRHDETFCNLPVILRAPATAETNAQSIRTMRKAIAATFPAIMDDTEAAREGWIYPSLSDDDAERIGAAIAELLYLGPSTTHADRFDTTGGNKTNKGLARTILSLFQPR